MLEKGELIIGDREIKPCLCFLGENDIEIIRIEANGDIFVKGRLIANDEEIIDGLKEFLSSHGIR